MRAFIFPGQGSQVVGMGKALAEASLVARETFQEVDEALEQNLFRLMTQGPAEDLTLTENAQPAIMANAAATLRVMEHEAGFRLAGKADFVAGHSLGEYTALWAAESFDLAVTARLLKVRGKAMQSAVPPGQGAMAALLGGTIEAAQALAETAAGAAAAETAETAETAAKRKVCTLANDNDPAQIVISGHKGAIDRAIAAAKEHGFKRAVLLPVSAPFHCPLMQGAADAMAEALTVYVPRKPLVPLVANVTAAPVATSAEIVRLLVAQVTQRVRWRESVQTMEARGVTHFVEFASKLLAPMVKRSLADRLDEVSIVSVITMDDIESVLQSL